MFKLIYISLLYIKKKLISVQWTFLLPSKATNEYIRGKISGPRLNDNYFSNNIPGSPFQEISKCLFSILKLMQAVTELDTNGSQLTTDNQTFSFG